MRILEELWYIAINDNRFLKKNVKLTELLDLLSKNNDICFNVPLTLVCTSVNVFRVPLTLTDIAVNVFNDPFTFTITGNNTTS